MAPTSPDQTNSDSRGIRRSNDLLHGAIGSTLLRLAGPMALGITSIILFNIVDTAYVGRLGPKQLAAISFTFPVTFLVMSIAMGLGIGTSSVLARAIGEGDREVVRRLATDSLLLANVIVVAVALVGLFTIDPLFRALGASPEAIELARRYMVPWYLGVGLLVIPMVGNSIIRATGDTKTPSSIMIIAGGVNIVLDPILIFGLGPFPRLELQGAALATVIAWAVTFVAAFWILTRRERLLTRVVPTPAQLIASWRRVLHIALPAAATSVLIPFSMAIVTRFVSSHGESAVAAFGIGTRVESFALVGITALGSGLAPFLGQNFGAGNTGRIRGAVGFSLRASLIWGAGVALLLWIFAWPLTGVFSRDEPVRTMAAAFLRIIPISYGCYGLSLLANSSFNAVHRPLQSTLIIAVRLGAFVLPLSWLGSRLFGVKGIFVGMGLANALIGLVAFLLVRRSPILSGR